MLGPVASSSTHSSHPPSPVRAASAGNGDARLELSFRAKSLQACDRCRAKKIKCQPLQHNVCQSCSNASTTCTFDLPITAARTKRIRRGLEPDVGNTTANVQNAILPDDERFERRSESPRRRQRTAPLTPVATSIRREGPTAMSYILHSAPTMPLSFLRDHDHVNGYTLHRSPASSNDGYILVASAQSGSVPSHEPPPSVLDALRSDNWTEVVSRLVETYLTHYTPLIPIVNKDDMSGAKQLLLLSMAAVAASRSNCPGEIFETLRFVVRKGLFEQDTMSDPSVQNIQILLVISLVDELAIQAGAAAPINVARTRLTAAIRMAQDLAMDIADPSSRLGAEKSRIWKCATVLDHWKAAQTGMRPIISHLDIKDSYSEDDFFKRLVSLTDILSKVIKTIYGTRGITSTTNADIEGVKASIKDWRESLPSSLTFQGRWSSLQAGLLHMLYVVVVFLLHRPFMRFSFIVPAHLDLSLDVVVWEDLSTSSKSAIEWAVDQGDLADLLFVGPYALSLCCFVQYHRYARRKEWDGVMMLEKACREGTERWCGGWNSDHLSLQRASLSPISLLYAASQTIHETGQSTYGHVRGLNPTPGILNKMRETSIDGITFIRDPSHPRGGILVATRQAAMEAKDLPEGTVIIGGPLQPDEELLGVPQNVSFANLLGDAALGDGRGGMSTPDWEEVSESTRTMTDEQCVSSFLLPGFEHLPNE
ncbi:hypothetical protein P7C73_g4178, partial [Tremellales sp. Uapishka_1]